MSVVCSAVNEILLRLSSLVVVSGEHIELLLAENTLHLSSNIHKFNFFNVLTVTAEALSVDFSQQESQPNKNSDTCFFSLCNEIHRTSCAGKEVTMPSKYLLNLSLRSDWVMVS